MFTHACRWILGGAVVLVLAGGVACTAAAPAPAAAPAVPAATPASQAPPKATPKAAPKAAPKPAAKPAPKPATAAVMAQYKGILTGDLVRTCRAKTGRTIARCNAEVRDGINRGLIIGPPVKPKPKAAPKLGSEGEYALSICMKQNGWTRQQCIADMLAGNAN